MNQTIIPIQSGCGCKAVRYQLATAPIEGAPAFAEYYDRELLLPEESLLRWRALLPAIEKYRAASEA